MKKTFITGFIYSFFFGVISLSTSAQEYKYDISKYYTPDIVRNQLDLSFNTNNSFNNSTYKSDSTQSSKSSQSNGTFSPNFTSYTNTRKRLTLFQLNGQFNWNYSMNKNFNIINPSTDFNSQDNLTLNYQSHFYNSSNQFFSLGINSNFHTTIDNNSTENNSVPIKGFNRDYSLGIVPTLGIGTGRIEQVEDARQAIYILDDFSKKGVLTRHLTDTEIFELSQLISRVKNKRFLDYRLHLIDEITTVDSFFVSNKLLDKSGAPYFTSLYDNWQYGALFSRKSGHSFEITVTPSYNWDYVNDSTALSYYRSRINQNSINGGLALTYTFEKPVNLNWQHSFSASLKGITSLYNSADNGNGNYLVLYNTIGAQTGVGFSSIGLNGRYTLGFYPNTRTNLSISLSQNVQSTWPKQLDYNSPSLNKELYSNTNVGFNGYYYISPQLRLTIGANIGYYYTTYTSANSSINNQLFGGVGGTLTYSIF